MVADQNKKSSIEITEKLNTLESRISRLEAVLHMEYSPVKDKEESEHSEQYKKISDGSLIESKIGEFGLAWLGNVVLFFGIVLLVQFVQKSGYQLGASIFGYLSVAGIFVLAVNWFAMVELAKCTGSRSDFRTAVPVS